MRRAVDAFLHYGTASYRVGPSNMAAAAEVEEAEGGDKGDGLQDGDDLEQEAVEDGNPYAGGHLLPPERPRQLPLHRRPLSQPLQQGPPLHPRYLSLYLSVYICVCILSLLLLSVAP